ncbi:protein kinase family protein [Roseospirillum parvum]|uniref:Protein kinase domain-containing protein n=1 Tax=Roseospirillum parvum TaxID=83401 RepID=A0A1G7XLL5_9PROT|nr:protein kinase family protein [Roseospirillum parvum]SDG84530.1 hypothetical protein SAMN05421742_10311 [Roseospirillum parvum]
MAQAPQAQTPPPQQSPPQAAQQPAQAQAQAPSAPRGPEAATKGPVTLRDRYLIHPDKPLPGLDMPHAKAYVCEDKRDAARKLYALICQRNLTPRISLMRAMRGAGGNDILTLHEWGGVPWPGGGRVIGLVYDQPMGGRVMNGLDDTFELINDREFTKRVLKPLTSALTEIAVMGVSHRAIRVDNLYFMDKERQHLVLGDCCSVPPAYDQPAIYEPIASAMCNPEGRGPGSVRDDCYALGVTLLVLLLGRSPVRNMSHQEMIRGKVLLGSYATLIGDNRVPLPLIEVLRGLLSDDESDRWGVEKLELWFNGRRTTPLMPRPQKRAQRSLKVGKYECYSLPEVGLALSELWTDALPILLEGRLETWLRRGLEDIHRADLVGSAMAQHAAGTKTQTTDALLSYMSALLLPGAPLRHGKLTLMPEGFGTALAVTMSNKGDTAPFIDMIKGEVVRRFLAAQETYDATSSQLESRFRELENYLRQAGAGNGIERCLYEMSDDQACLSPFFEHDFVYEIRELLPALDNAARRADSKTWPVDRHVAAFVAARYGRDTHAQISALNDPDPALATLSMLSVLAVLQWRLGPEQLPGLLSWLGNLMGPVLESYHSRERRRKLEKDIPRVVRKGSLTELFNLLDNREERARDEEEFAIARAEYQGLARRINDIEQGRIGRDERATRNGQQAAALIGFSITLITVTLSLLAHMF